VRSSVTGAAAAAIQLDDAAVARALLHAGPGLEKYRWLQAELWTRDVAHDDEFQKTFNGFYRVRRNSAWRSAFYALFELEKSKRRTFGDVLWALHASTGRVEASFASKLVASVNPDMPVIDSFVVKNLGLPVSRGGSVAERFARIVDLHNQIRRTYAEYLETEAGHDLVASFMQMYPGRSVTRTKMLDLVLWQAR